MKRRVKKILLYIAENEEGVWDTGAVKNSLLTDWTKDFPASPHRRKDVKNPDVKNGIADGCLSSHSTNNE